LAVSLIINGIKVNHIDNNDLPDHGLSPKERKHTRSNTFVL